MVALKNEMNMDADIEDIGERKTKVQAKLDAETDATKKSTLTKEIAEMDAILGQITADKPKLAAVITTLTARVTETGSAALTIGARIAYEEAGYDLIEAKDELDALEEHAAEEESWKVDLEVQIQMGSDEDELTLLNKAMAEVNKEIELIKTQQETQK